MKKLTFTFIPMALLSLLCLGALSGPERVELRPAPHKPGDIVHDPDWAILERSDIYEVGASKLERSSIRELRQGGVRLLTEAEARGILGDYYFCPPGKQPYLGTE